jgi:hypothetical protein
MPKLKGGEEGIQKNIQAVKHRQLAADYDKFYGPGKGHCDRWVAAGLEEELVRSGFGWVFTRYGVESFCEQWRRLEEQARKSRLGLWSGPNPMPPWEYRQGKKWKQIRSIERERNKMNRGGFSWKRLLGISAAKSRISRSIGIPHKD